MTDKWAGLREKAEAAKASARDNEWAAFDTACEPDVVLALLDERDRLERERDLPHAFSECETAEATRKNYEGWIARCVKAESVRDQAIALLRVTAEAYSSSHHNSRGSRRHDPDGCDACETIEEARAFLASLGETGT